MTTRLYLDNAATSFPKPERVYEAMMAYARGCGASPGRGQYAESREGARLIRQCRERLCRLFNGERPENVVFALNTSDALNLGIKGVVRAARLRGEKTIRVITTAMDHNSVLRPLRALGDEGVFVTHVEADDTSGLVSAEAVARAMDDGPRACLVVVNMASNVSGTIQPVAAMGAAARARGVLFMVDAAQALGHVAVDVREIGCDLMAFPGHKGLMGPQGTGGLYIRPGVETLVATTREGGTGSWSEVDAQPESMPERFEAGSHNTIGIVGLSEAVAWMLERGVATLRAHELELIHVFLGELKGAGVRHAAWAGDGPCAAMRLLGPADAEARVGVFALTHDTLEPAEIAAVLESKFGILARAGITCAPRAHETMGTLRGGGALRVSFGPFVTREDVLRLAEALREVCRHEPRVVVSDAAAIGLGRA